MNNFIGFNSQTIYNSIPYLEVTTIYIDWNWSAKSQRLVPQTVVYAISARCARSHRSEMSSTQTHNDCHCTDNVRGVIVYDYVSARYGKRCNHSSHKHYIQFHSPMPRTACRTVLPHPFHIPQTELICIPIQSVCLLLLLLLSLYIYSIFPSSCESDMKRVRLLFIWRCVCVCLLKIPSKLPFNCYSLSSSSCIFPLVSTLFTSGIGIYCHRIYSDSNSSVDHQ